MKLHFATFYSCADAENFVKENLTYQNGKKKNHIITKSDYWECWIVSWKGNTIHKRSGKSA